MSNIIQQNIAALAAARVDAGQRFKSVGTNKVKAPMTIAGVPGTATFYKEVASDRSRTYLPMFKWVSEGREKRLPSFGYKNPTIFRIEMRYDNSMGNGYNEFYFNVSTHEGWSNGEDFVEATFPEFLPLVKWSGCDSQIEEKHGNFSYHFNDRDHNGCKPGEKRQMLAGGSPDRPMWRLKVAPGSVSGKMSKVFAEQKLTQGGNYDTYRLGEIVCFKPGEEPPVPTLVREPIYASANDDGSSGKPRDIAAAIRCGYWHDCPVEDLMNLDSADLRLRYLQAVPAIREKFLTALHEAGIPLSMDDPLWPGRA